GTSPSITFTGTTLNGKTVTFGPVSIVSTGAFQRVTLPAEFTLLKSVTFAPGTAHFDHLVVQGLTLPSVTYAAAVAAVPTFVLPSQAAVKWYEFNTDTGNIDLVPSLDVAPGHITSSSGFFTSAPTADGNIMQFFFPGNLLIQDHVVIHAVGSRGLSIQVAD